MKTDKITIENIFKNQRRYIVPIFQRGYVWERERNWEPLWQNILDQVSVVRREKSGDIKNVRKHFLGSIVLNHLTTGVKHVSAAEIVDGQQRLLTLQTLLFAFRDRIRDLNDEWLNAELQLLTLNPGKLIDNNERFKVWPMNAYHKDLANTFEAGSAEALVNLYPQRRYYGKMIPPHPKLVEAYLFFYRNIDKYLTDTADDTQDNIEGITIQKQIQNAMDLYETLKGYIQLVEITLEIEDDPQVIFETLNWRGIPLEPSDLIRNFLFLDANRQGKNIENLYDGYWKIFDEEVNRQKFWKIQQKQGRLKRSRLDLFFFHYTTLRTIKDVRITHLYQEYKDWWEEDANRSIEYELERIKESSKIFKQLLEPMSDKQLNVTAQRLQILDITTVYPLILWLYENMDKLPRGDLEGILKDTESYLVRRLVCRLTTKNYNRFFLELLKKISVEKHPSRSFIQKELMLSKVDTSRWPDNEEFERSFIYEPVYSTLTPRRTRMILSAIEVAGRTKYQEKEFAPLPDQSSLTVEHVLPQEFKEDEWPYMQPYTTEEEMQKQKDERVRSLHSIGNLTLLTQPLNSEVSNGPFNKKRSEITKSLLVLNSYFQKYKDEDKWDERDINRRGRFLSKSATNLWKYPK